MASVVLLKKKSQVSFADRKAPLMPRDRGLVYQFERVPPDLWRHAKARAAMEGRSIRAVFLAFLQTYTSGDGASSAPVGDAIGPTATTPNKPALPSLPPPWDF